LDKEDGKRKYAALKLERNKINLMPLNWTIVHPIDEESPFYGKSKNYLLASDAEIIMLLKAFDESFSQVVYDKKSFRADEFVWGAKFVSIIEDTGEGMLHLNIDKIDKYEEVSLNSPLVNS
jgi:inward rectifier potassium channel